MSTLKIISCKGVIKVISINTDHLKVFTMVIAVTFSALLSPNFSRGMISLASGYSDSNVQVTIQAFLTGNFFSQGMAFGAV
jgi:hypothetical protein